MKIAVLSGKGGAGKTFVAVNLAVTAGKSTYIDCDVEEPNGWLFLKPQDVETQVVSTKIPAFDPDKCTGCRKCVDFCQFNALIYIKEKPKVFNYEKYSDTAADLLIAQAEIKMLKAELRAAYVRIAELEATRGD